VLVTENPKVNIPKVQVMENPTMNLHSGLLAAQKDAQPVDLVSLASENSCSSLDQQIIQKLADFQAELANFNQENFKLQQSTNKTMEAMVANQDLPSLRRNLVEILLVSQALKMNLWHS
jgi:K+-transporting ATPase c subunit